MEKQELTNTRIINKQALATPNKVKSEIPITPEIEKDVLKAREDIRNILSKKDDRFILIVGPCSIHNKDLAIDYAKKLKVLSEEISDIFLVIMRVYFEKPRTNIGWKGLINDPDLNNTYDINNGLRLAREILFEINKIGVPCATEALDPFIPQYLDDLLSWSAIGARTVESQIHRDLVSGLSCPVGFKNSTDGNIESAANAMKAAARSHHFISLDTDGICCTFQTNGNKATHCILRGGGNRPNYDSVSVDLCEKALEKAGVPVRIMIDCSHGNSRKDHKRQSIVFEDCIHQIRHGNKSILGFMIESNIKAGNQKLTKDLEYGVSITDACIDWEETESICKNAQKLLKNRN